MALAYDSNGKAVIDAYETERTIPGLQARDGAIVIRTAGTASMLLAKRDVSEEGEEQVPFIMDVASSYGWMSGTPPQKATITTP